MGGTEDGVLLDVDEGDLPLGVLSPEQEDHGPGLGIEHLDHGVGERLPPLADVRAREAQVDRQGGVEQHDAPVGPGVQATVARRLTPQVVLQLPEDVDQALGEKGEARADGEGQAVGTEHRGVGVLAQDHHPHLVEGVGEGVEHLAGRGQHRHGLAPGLHPGGELAEVGRLELVGQGRPPARVHHPPTARGAGGRDTFS